MERSWLIAGKLELNKNNFSYCKTQQMIVNTLLYV